MTVYSHSRLSCFEQCPQKFKLVNRYAELQNKKKQIKLDLYAEIEKLEEAIIHYAEKESIDVVFGSNNKIKIKTSQRYSCPSKHSREREQLEQILREHGKWDEVAQLDTTVINKIIQEKKWDSEIIDALEEYVKLEQSKRLYLSKIKNE